MRKNALGMFLCCALTLCAAGCGATVPPSGEARTPRIVATIFPLYDWTREILGDRADAVELSMLLDNGTDMHSYQPSVDDIVKVSSCDLFLYVGGESDSWVKDALPPDLKTLNLMETLGEAAVEERIERGMSVADDDESAYDEHVWLSLRNAERLCRAIADALGDVDPDGAAAYAANAEAYCAQLAALDEAYTRTVEAAPLRELLFADRFPFRYLADDYGLNVYAAFPGCSAETEASFQTVATLAAALDAYALPVVLTTESGDGRLARTVIDASKSGEAVILSMNSLQSVTAADIASGTRYLSAMEENLNVLRQALGA